MNATPTRLYILGVPFCGGQPKGGVDLGPTALRQAGLEKLARDLGYDVVDLGDLDAKKPQDLPTGDFFVSGGKAKNPRWVGDTTQRTAKKVVEELKPGCQDTILLSLGGDHSIAIGTISGILDAHVRDGDQDDASDLCVIWVDAHSDINTPATSASGNVHGMPVAFLMRDPSLVEPWKIPGFEWMLPSTAAAAGRRNRQLNPNKLVYIGLRDVDEGEEEILRRYNIKNYRIPEVRAKGVDRVMEEAIEYLRLGPGSTSRDYLHLSFDIDGLDPGACPATGTAVENGLTVQEGCAISEACGKTGRLVGMDLVEVNPALSDTAGALSTTHAGVKLIESALSGYKAIRRHDA